MLIYLASPYSANEVPLDRTPNSIREERFQQACKQAADLMLQGHAVFSPIAHSHSVEIHGLPAPKLGKEGYDFWLKQDFSILINCDEMWVLMLDGWKESKGIKAELAFCKRYEIPVKYIKFGSIYPEVIRGSSQEVVA